MSGDPAPRGVPEQGFGLLEVSIAFALLLLVLIPISLLLTNVLSQAATSRDRLTALSIAEKYIEELNNTGPHLDSSGVPITDTPTLEKTITDTNVNVTYKVYSDFSWTASEGTNPDLCTSGSVPLLMNLKVTVDWSSQTLSDSTVVDYPPPGIPTYGFLAVQIEGDPPGTPPKDANGYTFADRVHAVPVTITSGSGNTTLYPDDYGCVFEQVAPGSYTVSVANPTPGVPSNVVGNYGDPSFVANYDEETSQSTAAPTVSAGQVSNVTFQYDEGTLVNLSYPSTTATEDGVVCPGVGKLQCLATGQSPANTTAPSSNPVATVSVWTSTGWAAGSLPSGVSRLSATACAGTNRCIGVGYGPNGAGYQGASVSDNPASPASFTADALPAGTTALTGVTCPSSGTCYAIGSGATAAVALSASVTSSAVTWSSDALPAGTTTLSALACPSTTVCYALGVTPSGATVVSLAGDGTSWTADTLPAGTATLSALACPSTTVCYALGTTTAGPTIVSLAAGGTTWIADTLPTGTASLSTLACPSTTVCYALGTGASGPAIVSLAAGGTTWTADTGIVGTSLTGLTCPSTSVCFVTGATATAAEILSPSSSTAWTADTLPSGTRFVTQVACSSATACDAVGSTSSAAVILSLGSGGTTWKADTLPSGAAPVFFSGVACTSTVCGASGGSETGALLFDGTPTGTTWSNGTPSGLKGMYVGNLPVTVSSSGLSPTSPLELTAPATDATQVGPLYPFSSGYAVAAGDCASELATASASVATVPGGTPSVTLPLGLLPVEVVTATGAPVSGATLTATVSDGGSCSVLTPLSGTNPSSYALEPTGPDGMSRLALVYDTYTVTATAGTLTGSVTVQITPTTTVVGGVVQPLPEPVVVTVK